MLDHDPGVLVSLLSADDAASVRELAVLRWTEWGDENDLAAWTATTSAECGSTGLPVTFVARLDGTVAGGVGMAHHDPEGLPDRSPWVVGTVVRRELRSRGIGRALMRGLEAWARPEGITSAWVSTSTAVSFYRQCGWRADRTISTPAGHTATVLTKEFRK